MQLFFLYLCRVFREAGGIPPVVRLTQSREHTPRVIFAAHKVIGTYSVYVDIVEACVKTVYIHVYHNLYDLKLLYSGRNICLFFLLCYSFVLSSLSLNLLNLTSNKKAGTSKIISDCYLMDHFN